MRKEFEMYQLSPLILESLSMIGYLEPTPIQSQVIPYILNHKDVVAKSQTGSGKTAAFAIPICHLVNWESNAPQALILEPTRELALQVKDEFFVIGRKKRLKIPVVFGGFPIDKQTLTLKQKSHIVVGTPGRVLDHIERGSLNIDQIKYLVIDEADLMSNMGFMEDVRRIIASLLEDRVTMLFSATLGDSIESLIADYMKNPIRVEIEGQSLTVDEILQEAYYVENEEKMEWLLTILINEIPDYCMIFCGTREMVTVLYHKMKKERIKCGMLHGLMDQKERIRSINDFRDGQFRYLICTDVAARGIDFDNITHVINYDFPTGRESYVHRIGRTGRNGSTGKAISLITESDRKMQEAVEEFMVKTITICDKPKNEKLLIQKKLFNKQQNEKVKVKQRKDYVFKKQIVKLCIGGGKKSKIRASDIVGTICNIEGISDKDIGIIDIRDSVTYVEILNGHGTMVLDTLQDKTIKGKIRKVRICNK